MGVEAWWRKIAQVLGALSLVFAGLGCGGTDGSTPSGGSGTSGNGGRGGGGGSGGYDSVSGNGGTTGGHCSGLAGERVVSSLTAAERDAACQSFNRCAAAPFQAAPLQSMCRFVGNLAVRLADPAPATDAEAASICTRAYDKCAANPDTPASVDETIQRTLARTCEGTESCGSTLAEVERCQEAVADSSAWTSRPCSEATAEQTATKAFTEIDSCSSLPLTCLLLFAERK